MCAAIHMDDHVAELLLATSAGELVYIPFRAHLAVRNWLPILKWFQKLWSSQTHQFFVFCSCCVWQTLKWTFNLFFILLALAVEVNR